MYTVAFDLLAPFTNLSTDPFCDQLTVRFRPADPVDLFSVFGEYARGQMYDLECGNGTASVRVYNDYLTVSASPVKIVHGVNAFPRNSNRYLVSTFLYKLSEALSQLAAKDVHLVLDGIIRVDLTVMADVGDPAYAQKLFGLLRQILRCTLPDDADGRFRARFLYDNSIIFGRYSDDFSVKLYRKSDLLTSGLDPIDDRCIRIEISVSEQGAAELMQIVKIESLEHILVNARYLFNRITSGFVLMPRQLQSAHRAMCPVPEIAAAYHAWLEHGWTSTLYPPQDRKAVALACRHAGIDLSQPPVPVRVSDRLRPALRTTLVDLLDPRRVTLLGPGQARGAHANPGVRHVGAL